MKKIFIMSICFAWSVNASSAGTECYRKLEELIANRNNLAPSKLDITNVYNCGTTACALTFPINGSDILSFYDEAKGDVVTWSPVRNGQASGWESVKKNRNLYLYGENVGDHTMPLRISLETPRDAMFWPPHRVLRTKNYTCTRQ